MLGFLCYLFTLWAVTGAKIEIPTGFKSFEHIDVFSNHIEHYLNGPGRATSNQCRDQLELYKNGLRIGERWALEMLDSSAKIPTGILLGSTGDLGAFNECMNIEVDRNGTIVGKYCVGFMPLNLLGDEETNVDINRRGLDGMYHEPMYYATCAPNGCTATEVQDFYRSFGIPVVVTENLCQDKLHPPELEGGAIATVVFFSVVLGIMVLSTLYDTVLHYTKKKPVHVSLLAFSVLTNMRKLTTINSDSNQLLCLHGIRTLSLMWVIMGHRYTNFRRLAVANYAEISDWLHHEYNMFLMGAHVCVDTFLFLGGLLITYTYLNAMAKGVRFNVIKYYIHRILRLTPALGALILLVTNIAKFFGRGPLWRVYSEGLGDICRDNWWSTLFYIQNYVDPANFCMTHTWYLAVDMQLFILSPIILIPLARKPKIGYVLMGIATVAASLSPFLIAWFYEIRTMMNINGMVEAPVNFGEKFYYATHTRAAPWVIGLILGCVVYHTKRGGIKRFEGVKYFKIMVLLGWCMCFLLMYACVFAWHDLIIATDYNQFEHSAQIGLTRPGWAIAVSWVILACIHGYGGPVNWFLSLSVFQYFSKISYSMFLIHFIPILIQALSAKLSFTFGNFENLYIYWGDIFYGMILGTIWVLAFESPIIALEKVIFGAPRSRRRKAVNDEKRNPNETVKTEENVEKGNSAREQNGKGKLKGNEENESEDVKLEIVRDSKVSQVETLANESKEKIEDGQIDQKNDEGGFKKHV